MVSMDELKATAAQLGSRGRGILAADESVSTIGKRLIAHGLQNTSETRRAFREILLTSPGNERAFSGIILFHETVYQSTKDGKPFASVLRERGILMGVKVDSGLKPLENSPLETRTSGLDEVRQRCCDYRAAGARFVKWRAALRIDVARGLPSQQAVLENARTLAVYAREAQAAGLVPIVEPEVLIDGQHGQEVSESVSKRVIECCYKELRKEGVVLEATLLKPMMIMPGIAHEGREKVSARQVAERTLHVMKTVVPREVGGIVFLSGGMSERQATVNLNELNKCAEGDGEVRWPLSFSYGRALQTSVMEAWNGVEGNLKAAGEVAAALGLANAQAQLGRFDGAHPSLQQDRVLYEGFRGWRSSEDAKGV